VLHGWGYSSPILHDASVAAWRPCAATRPAAGQRAAELACSRRALILWHALSLHRAPGASQGLTVSGYGADTRHERHGSAPQGPGNSIGQATPQGLPRTSDPLLCSHARRERLAATEAKLKAAVQDKGNVQLEKAALERELKGLRGQAGRLTNARSGRPRLR